MRALWRKKVNSSKPHEWQFLPEELAWTIFCLLSPKELVCSVRLVCHEWKALAQDESIVSRSSLPSSDLLPFSGRIRRIKNITTDQSQWRHKCEEQFAIRKKIDDTDWMTYYIENQRHWREIANNGIKTALWKGTQIVALKGAKKQMKIASYVGIGGTAKQHKHVYSGREKARTYDEVGVSLLSC